MPTTRTLAAVLVAAWVVGCSAQQKVPFTHLKYMDGQALPGSFYPADSGDTLLSIAEKFDCNIHVLAQINDLRVEQSLGQGDKVFIPRMRGEFPAGYYAQPRESGAATVATQAPSAPQPTARPAIQSAAARAPKAAVPAKSVAKAAASPAPSRDLASARTAAPGAAVNSASAGSKPAASPGRAVTARATPTPASIAKPSRPILIAETNPKPAPTVSPLPAPEPVRYAYKSSVAPRFPFSTQAQDLPRTPAASQPPSRSQTFAQSSRSQATSSLSSADLGPMPVQPPVSTRARVAGALPFQRPCPGGLSSTFHDRRSDHLHKGIDIAAPTGTPIRAAYGGKIIYAGNNILPALGNMILVEHPGGWVTVYAHNSKNLVREGERVQTGQVIGLVGSTGRSTGAHLHFEIRKNAADPVNPELYLP